MWAPTAAVSSKSPSPPPPVSLYLLIDSEQYPELRLDRDKQRPPGHSGHGRRCEAVGGPLMYRLWAYEAFGTWVVTLTYVPTRQEREAGSEGWVERATVGRKPGRNQDLDAMQAMSWSLERWFQWACESTP